MDTIIQHEPSPTFWSTTLEGSWPAESFRDKPGSRTFLPEVDRADVRLGEALHQNVLRFCEEHQITLVVVLLSALRATHSRLTGASNAEIGLLLGNRQQSNADVNVELHSIRSIVQNHSFRDLIQQMQTYLVSETRTRIGPSKGSSIQASIEDERATTSIPLALHLESPSDNTDQQTGYPLQQGGFTIDVLFHLSQQEGALQGSVVYSKDSFHRDTIMAAISTYHEVLAQCIEHADAPITSLPLSGCLCPWQDTKALDIEREHYPKNLTVVDVFRQQAAACPSTIAVRDFEGELTYAELDRLSDRMSLWLGGRGLHQNSLIGVYGTQSRQTIVAFLGVLKSGLAYFPLDVEAPALWTLKVLASVPGNTLVLFEDHAQPPAECMQTGKFSAITKALGEVAATNILPRTGASVPEKTMAENLAYVMFRPTLSGHSTGVMIDHRAIINLAKQCSVILPLSLGTAVAQTANITQSASTWEIYTAILNGGSLICVRKAMLVDSTQRSQLFHRENIKLARFYPEALERYLSESPSMFADLLLLVSCGAPLPPETARKALLYCPKGRVYNAYSVTEGTDLTTLFLVSRNDVSSSSAIPIGRPVINAGAAVVDSQYRVVPAGIVGELVITGDGLAQGYLNPQYDEDCFIDLFTGNNQPIRAYRTGDIVRIRPTDGEFEFLGRLDNRFKALGHRVQPRSVEHALLAHDLVKDAAAVVYSDDTAGLGLAGFITLRTDRRTLHSDAHNDADNDTDAVAAWTKMYDTGVYSSIGSISSGKIGRDFVGWRSMYDGQRINEDQMNEWLQDTLRSLLDGQPPGHILEIGSGTGMILLNLGEGLESYIGLEPVPNAAHFVNETAKSIPHLAGKVVVQVGAAGDAKSLDCLHTQTSVVINSVVQHFPSLAYLESVVADLLSLTPVHRIFFGDIRSFALYDEFLVEMARYRLGSQASHSQLLQFLERAKARERELLVDPGFFTSLKSQYPDLVDHVEILPKRMRARNELSCYRYSAIVYTKRRGKAPLVVRSIEEDQWIDFKDRGLDYSSLKDYLLKRSDLSLVPFSNIPNSRTTFESAIAESLLSNTGHVQEYTLDRTNTDDRGSLTPSDLEEIAKNTGFHVELSCARQHSRPGSFDAVFHHYPPSTKGAHTLFDFPTDYKDRPVQSLASQPENFRFDRMMEKKVHLLLQKSLPAYMVPNSVNVLARLPTNDSGSTDRRALARMADLVEVDRRI